jgi:predicted HicB family RNase H-like nuclease
MDKLKQTMTDKGSVGSVEFSDADGVFFGKVQGGRSLILYEGETREALQADFREAVDAYLELCQEKS